MSQDAHASPPTPATVPPPPPPVQIAANLLYGVAALALVGIVIGFALRDQVEQAVVGDSGMDTGFAAAATGVGLVFGTVFAVIAVGVYVTLSVFLRRGIGWVRITTTVIAGLAVLSALGGLGSAALSGAIGVDSGQPPAYTVARSVISLALWVAITVLLWRPASNAFFAAAKAQRAARP